MSIRTAYAWFLVYNWYFYENTVFFKKPKRETFALKKYNIVMK